MTTRNAAFENMSSRSMECSSARICPKGNAALNLAVFLCVIVLGIIQ